MAVLIGFSEMGPANIGTVAIAKSLEGLPRPLSLHGRGDEDFDRELLYPLSVLHFGDVEIAFRIHVHVMHDIELAGRDAVAAEGIQRLESLAVQNPHPRRAAA